MLLPYCFYGALICWLLGTGILGNTNTEKSIASDVVMCGDQMECVSRHLCNDDGNIVKDGHALIDYRRVKLEKPYAAKVKLNDTSKCEWTQICCSQNKKIPDHVEKYLPKECGYSNPYGLAITLQHTLNGEAQFGEFPWMVIIMKKTCTNDTCDFEAMGGGSLLAPNVVLTVAHKIHETNTEHLMVRAGEWDTKTTAEYIAHQDRNVKTKIIHDNFNKHTAFYDAALLLLDTPFALNKHIGTICLPDNWEGFQDSHCFVMGWGKKHFSDLDYPNLLKKIELPLVAPSKCQNQLRKTRLGRHFELHNSFICAGGEKDKDSCLGDGGAPLVCSTSEFPDTIYQLAGIVSWGLDCGVENVPAVYVNVSMLQPWIEKKLNLTTIQKH